jgi:octaprenyl-diphosphate synthase
LHDDVVDDSSLRRGKPTANSIWGDQASVLVGDLIYARASELMAQTGSLDIVETFAAAIRHMSEGELFQLEQVFNLATTEETYFRILNFKTAVLIAASCKSAGILAKASTAEISALEEFGAAVGMAFQLVDDALDYLGSREIFGKPTNSDLLEGKVTLPIILLKERATGLELESLKAILSKPKVTQSDIHIVCELVNKYDAAKATIDRANEFTDKALNALKIFPESTARKDLETLAKRLVWRFN